MLPEIIHVIKPPPEKMIFMDIPSRCFFTTAHGGLFIKTSDFHALVLEPVNLHVPKEPGESVYFQGFEDVIPSRVRIEVLP